MRIFFLFVSANLRSRAFISISICFSLFLLLIPYFIAFVWVEKDEAISILAKYFGFPIVYNTMGIFQYYPIILFGSVIILLITKGFEDGTFKILLMNGLSKTKIWLDTVLFCLILSTVLFLVTCLLTFHIGYIKTNYTFDFTFDGFHWLLIYYFQTFVVLLYAVATALTIKHSGTAIFVFLFYLLIVERWLAYILDKGLNLYPIFRFLPGKVIEDLTYMDPNPNFVIQHLEVQDARWVASIVWLFIVLLGSFVLFKKSDYTR